MLENPTRLKGRPSKRKIPQGTDYRSVLIWLLGQMSEYDWQAFLDKFDSSIINILSETDVKNLETLKGLMKEHWDES